MNMGPVKPDLPVQTVTLILKTFTRNYIKIKLESSNLKLRSSIFICDFGLQSSSVASIPLWRVP